MPADAVLYNCMAAIQSAIQGLSLTGIDSGDVYLHKVPTAEGLELPCILISASQEELPRDGGTNVRDDITYNIVVSIVDGDNQSQSADFEQYLEWRQKIRRAFHSKRLSGVSESVICYVRPLVTVHPDAWESNLFISMLAVQCVCRETRT